MAELNKQNLKKPALTIRDMMDMSYDKFVKALGPAEDKKTLKNGTVSSTVEIDPKIVAVLNMGRKDGFEGDEVVKINDKASFKVKDLKPTQSQIGLADSLGYLAKFDPEGAKKIIDGDTSVFENRRIVTANGKFIIDGHHRWSQVYLLNPDATMPAIDMEIPGFEKPENLLKIVQLAIAAAYGKISLSDANTHTDIFDEEKMSNEKMQEKIPEILNQKPENGGKTMMEVCREAWGLETDKEVTDRIIENADAIKKMKPDFAPERSLMPQPEDTANKSGGKLSDFDDKLQSGELNFRKPFVPVSESIVMNFEDWFKAHK